MTFILIGIVYVLLLGFLVRFFRVVHRWDEEISSMELKEQLPAEQTPQPKAA